MIKMEHKMFDVSNSSFVDSKANVEEMLNTDRYTALMFYPKDFTYICPTELEALGDIHQDLEHAGASVYAVSTDTVEVHNAWRTHDKRIKGLPFGMIADPTHHLAQLFGIYNQQLGVSERGMFVIKEGKILFALISSIDVGRDPKLLLDFIEAHKTGKRTPCKWSPGKEFV